MNSSMLTKILVLLRVGAKPKLCALVRELRGSDAGVLSVSGILPNSGKLTTMIFLAPTPASEVTADNKFAIKETEKKCSGCYRFL